MRRRDRILVVDDDFDFRELYKTALRFEGFDVDVASDGFAALHLIDVQPPSLVVLDLHMPRVDGWSVMRELESHSDTRAIPVIVVTGADVRKPALRAVAILHKPVMPDQLLPYIHHELHGIPRYA